EEHLVARRDEPDVGLASVQVEGLDDAGVHLAIVDLLHLESRQGGMHARREPAQLCEASAVVTEALELDDIHTLDGRLGGVILDRERALRLVVQAHGATPRLPIGSSISLPIIAVLTRLCQEARALSLDPTGNGGNRTPPISKTQSSLRE